MISLKGKNYNLILSLFLIFYYSPKAFSDIENGSHELTQEVNETKTDICITTTPLEKGILATAIIGTACFLGITTYTLFQHLEGFEINPTLNLILSGNGASWFTSSLCSLLNGSKTSMNYCICTINAIAFVVHFSLAIDQFSRQ